MQPQTVDLMAKEVRRAYRGAYVTNGKEGERIVVTKDGTKIIGRGASSREAWTDAVARLRANQ